MKLVDLLNRPIAYHRCFVPLAGVTGAVLLSQAIYWTKKTTDPDGWFWKTSSEWEEETGLTRREQETSRKRLSGILEEKKEGIPRRLFFKINFKNLEEAMHQSAILVSTRKITPITKTTTKSITKVIQVEEKLPQDTSEFSRFMKTEDYLSETCSWVSAVCLKFKKDTPAHLKAPFSVPSKPTAKYLKDIDKYISQLQQGTFFETNTFDANFLKYTSPEEINLMKGLSKDTVRKSIVTAMDFYCQARNNSDRYNFINRDRTISMADFIYECNQYNNVLGISHFWKYLVGPGVENKSDKPYYELKLKKYFENNMQKMLVKCHNNYERFSEEEQIRLLKSILYLTKWWFKNYNDLLDKYAGKLHILFPLKHVTFIERFFAEYINDNNFQHPVKISSSARWTEFVVWLNEKYEIELKFSTKKVVVNKSRIATSDNINITEEELDRRMNAD